MDETTNLNPPPVVSELTRAAATLGFTMSSEPLTGSLLRALVASKPAGEILELGTGVGVGTAWLLAGMNATAHLTTVDLSEKTIAIARSLLGSDPRVTFQHMDGIDFINACQGQREFDLIFADSFPGKFESLNETLALLKKGGFYVIDDLNPQPKWEPDHPPKVEQLIRVLEGREDLLITKLNWSSGVLVGVKR